jgi:transposase
MVYRIIHRDVKIAAIQLSERQLLPLKDILLCCGFSRCTFYRILKLWQETGDVINEPPVMRGRYQTLHHTDIHYLLQLIRQNPDYFLDELLCMLKTNHFISVHYTTIHDELICAGVSQKRLQCIALERNEALRADFISRMAQLGNATGYPGVIQGNPHPYPQKPVGTGAGFHETHVSDAPGKEYIKMRFRPIKI